MLPSSSPQGYNKVDLKRSAALYLNNEGQFRVDAYIFTKQRQKNHHLEIEEMTGWTELRIVLGVKSPRSQNKSHPIGGRLGRLGSRRSIGAKRRTKAAKQRTLPACSRDGTRDGDERPQPLTTTNTGRKRTTESGKVEDQDDYKVAGNNGPPPVHPRHPRRAPPPDGVPPRPDLGGRPARPLDGRVRGSLFPVGIGKAGRTSARVSVADGRAQNAQREECE